MGRFYFDTSALSKYYFAEPGTELVVDIFSNASNRSFVSNLVLLELYSAFARRVRTKQSSELAFSACERRLNADVTSGKIFRTMRLTSLHFEEAERLLRCYATRQNLRSLDALQLASALVLKTFASLDAFVCSDEGLCEVAKMEGLKVINPAVSYSS